MSEWVLVNITDPQRVIGTIIDHLGPLNESWRTAKPIVEAWRAAKHNRAIYGGIWIAAELPHPMDVVASPPRPKPRESA